MTSKGQHVQDSAVVERRLRPIYDFLDIGNNKKALQECDKVLKKTPSLQCAKALKALTLHRMGKGAEAEVMLEGLSVENPTDEATLQAMTLCYRELQQLEKICKIYETAVKLEPNNEELFTHLFMSYVRVFDFKAQQQAAMILYKNKPKTPYYCWAVMSIILQATRGEGRNDPKKRNLLLSLAERMMEKLIIDGKLDAEQEVQLYVMVLELQGKNSEVLVILDGPLGTKLACSNLPQGRIKYYAALGMWDEINLLCKSLLVESVDRWDLWKVYLDSVFKLMESKTENHIDNHVMGELETVDDTPEKCHEFICRIVENGADNGFLLRGPYLARLDLFSRLADPTDLLGDPAELFIEYFRKFGHKPCCVSDLRPYLHLLPEAKRSDLASKLVKDVGVTPTTVPQSEQQMQRHLCSVQLSRLCGAHRNLPPEHLRALVTAFSLHYQHGYQSYGGDLLPTDLGPADPYALLAAHVLYDLGVLEGSSDPVVAALVLLENLLKNSPSNFHAKLLCIRLYHVVGGTLGAQTNYASLDTKHLQLDSLGFVHCAHLSTTGMFSLSAALFDVTLKFFSSNYKDSSDHITFCYKYGSFTKIEEFMDFRERLNNSLHYTTVAIDRIVLSLVECTNLEGLYNINISPKDDKIDWGALADNNDFGVYVNWDSEEDTRQLFNEHVLFLKLRTSVLWGLSASVDVIKSSDGVKTKHLEALGGLLKEWEDLTEEARKESFPSGHDRITFPLPSRLRIALDSPYYEIIGNCFKVLIEMGKEKPPSLLIENLEKSMKKLLEKIEDRTKTSDNLRYRKESLEYVVNAVEVLSLASLVCLLCNDLIKPQGKKKKKVNDKARDSVNCLANLLKVHVEKLGAVVQGWSDSIVFAGLSEVLEGLSLSDERGVCETIASSYSTACGEIQGVLKSKLKMLSCIS